MSSHRRTTTLSGIAGVAALFLGLVGAAACAPGWDVVSIDHGLYPAFQYAVTDYVNRCDPNDPTEVSISAPEGSSVSVAGQPAQGGVFQVEVAQQHNESFSIVIQRPEETSTHHVRCLPAGFPEWEAVRSGTPVAEYYSTVIIEGFGSNNVPVIFDTNGVPMWWTEPQATFLLTPFENGNLAITNIGGGMTERGLDGAPVRVLDTVGDSSDFHDVLRLDNGNYVMATLERRACDLTPWGEGPGGCLFHTFQELTPDGDVVWEWRAEDDIPLSETTTTWRGERDFVGRADPWHYNSVEWTGDGFVISFRHMDAIYKVDYATRDVVWKLGGTPTAQSLQIVGDPIGSFSGQHDARWLPGGVVTLYDNQSRTGRPPRAVAYQIDEGARTAQLVHGVEDPIAPFSGCCGSVRYTPGGTVVTGWGGTPWITENDANGNQLFRLDANFIYRGVPIYPGSYTRDELRAGMDAQYTDGVFAHGTAARQAVVEPDDPPDVSLQLGATEDAVSD